MGCQENIAKAIVKQEANYILSVKENQKQLYQNIEDEFKFNKAIQTHIHQDLGHGRIETRKCSVINTFEFIEKQDKWSILKGRVKIESLREFKNSDKPNETATRYYITSLEVMQKNYKK